MVARITQSASPAILNVAPLATQLTPYNPSPCKNAYTTLCSYYDKMQRKVKRRQPRPRHVKLPCTRLRLNQTGAISYAHTGVPRR